MQSARVQHGPHRPQGAPDLRLDGAQRQGGLCGDLLVAETAKKRQGQHLARRRTQARQCLVQMRLAFAAGQPQVWGGQIGGGQRGGVLGVEREVVKTPLVAQCPSGVLLNVP